jgi:predicted nucleic acid-binding protein
MSRLVVLDNEAVQALRSPTHPKHHRVLSHVQVVAGRKRRVIPISLAVPTAVRVEAGWDRTSTEWAFLNRLRVADVPLEAARANTAAAIRNRTKVSVADAHIGAIVQTSTSAEVTVVTSDPNDIRLVAGDRDTTIVTR